MMEGWNLQKQTRGDDLARALTTQTSMLAFRAKYCALLLNGA